MEQMKTLMDVYGVAREIDPNMEIDSPEFNTATLLLSFLVVGPNARRLQKFCKLPPDFVATRIARLRDNNIIMPDESFKVDWFEEDGGAIAFHLDCQIADGYVERDGEHNYKITPAGVKRIEGMLAK